MAVESPADVVVIGLNRLSLEAALYARFLGYRVTLLGDTLTASNYSIGSDRNEFSNCTTTLGRKAIEAQGHDSQVSEIVDINSLVKLYFGPLSRTDLLSDCFVKNCNSIQASIGESELPAQPEEDVEYDTRIFELKIQLAVPESSRELTADVLIDCRDVEEKSIVAFSCDFDSSIKYETEKTGSQRLLTATDDFYVIGAGRLTDSADLSFEAGLLDIRDLFRILGDSSTLDLYASND